MTTGAQTTTPAGSTWALLTHRVVTWRQAGEGSAVLTAFVLAAVASASLVKLRRLIAGPRG